MILFLKKKEAVNKVSGGYMNVHCKIFVNILCVWNFYNNIFEVKD